MTENFVEDSKRSEKKMEKEDGLKTVECLRGRLFAERQASRVANEDADLLAQKLIELETQLKEETKLRDRTEKKLRFLKKRLKSLKICPISDESEQCSSASDNCSSSCTSGPRDSEENEPKVPSPKEDISEILKHNAVDNISNQSHITSSEGNSISPCNSDSNLRDIPSENLSSPSSKPLKKIETNTDEENDADDSLALVPVTFPETQERYEPRIINNFDGNVGEVLENLRQLREKLQSTLQQRRPMIEVGPTQMEACK